MMAASRVKIPSRGTRNRNSAAEKSRLDSTAIRATNMASLFASSNFPAPIRYPTMMELAWQKDMATRATYPARLVTYTLAETIRSPNPEMTAVVTSWHSE